MQFQRNRMAGFTLTEILVAVAIVAVLATISVPAYKSYMHKVRRSDAHVSLAKFAMAMERQYVMNNTYNATGTVADVFQDTSDEGYYTMTFGTIATTSFVLYASPTGVQVGDTECGTFSLNQLGAKGVDGTENVAHCW